jgi:hypothetical protein
MLVLASVPLACGSDDNGSTDQRIQEAEKRGRQEERLKQQEERLKRLERELRKEDQSRGSSGSTQNQSGSLPGRSCGGGLSVNQNTSCSFAREVRAAYERSGGSGTVTAYSPVTKQAYTMSCSGGLPVICTGGNNAAVSFR